MANKKQIINLLTEKSSTFLKLFEGDKSLQNKLQFKFFISGGCIASIIDNEEPSDYDIYFMDTGSMLMATEYLKASRPDVVVYKGGNALTLTDRFQIITRYCDLPDMIVNKFDFAHCKCYFVPGKVEPLTIHKDAMESIATKHLIYDKSANPIGALFRLNKFFQRGWNITKSNWLKIVMDVSSLDLKSPISLREQLSFMSNRPFLSNLDFDSEVSIEYILKELEESDKSLPKLKPNTDSDPQTTGY